jgi:hypothetical protein
VDKLTTILDYCPEVYQQKVHIVSFLQQVKFTPKDTKNNKILEFTVYCDPFYEVNAYAKRSEESRVMLSRFSVIEYMSVTLGTKCVGQIIAIIEFNGIIQFILSRLIEEKETATFRKLPYPLMCYAMEPKDNTRFVYEHVPLQDVIGPCFSVPAVDHDNMTFKLSGRHHGKKENKAYFYVLSPSRTCLFEDCTYENFMRFNKISHPWDKKMSSKSCLNFHFYLGDDEKVYIRDVLNV